MRMSDEISKMIENSQAVIQHVRADIEAGRITGADAVAGMKAVAQAQSLILKAIADQRRMWKERQRKHRAKPSDNRPIL